MKADALRKGLMRRGNNACGLHIIHRAVIERVMAAMPQKEKFNQLAELFKVYGDDTRLKILYALLKEEMCVCDIAALLDMTQSAISHQLRVLKQADIVKYRRAGRVVYYSLKDDHVSNIFAQGFEHISNG